MFKSYTIMQHDGRKFEFEFESNLTQSDKQLWDILVTHHNPTEHYSNKDQPENVLPVGTILSLWGKEKTTNDIKMSLKNLSFSIRYILDPIDLNYPFLSSAYVEKGMCYYTFSIDPKTIIKNAPMVSCLMFLGMTIPGFNRSNCPS